MSARRPRQRITSAPRDRAVAGAGELGDRLGIAAVVVVAVAFWAETMLYGLVIPLLPGISDRFGISETGLGLLVGAYGLAFMIATPILGRWIDRHGYRLPMLWIPASLAAATLLFALTDDLALLILARLIQGAAAAATSIAGNTLLADVFPANKRGKMMGIALFGTAAGMLTGPPLGGILSEWGGYSAPFLVAFGIMVADGLARVVLMRRIPSRHERVERDLALSALRSRKVRMVLLVALSGAGTLALLEATLPLYLTRHLDASAPAIGLLFAGATLSWGVTAPMMGSLSDRVGREPLIALGCGITCVALPLITLPGSVILYIGPLLLVGLALGTMTAPLSPYLSELIDREYKGRYGSICAFYYLAHACGMMLGPFVGGALTEALSLPQTLWIASAAIAVTGLTVLATRTRPR